ncbi:hypothetical protein [Fretibacter rubidus]|uniref:hypothetical protein n=1 Tax=Fretibacter rubidus TaxID=570162 RepID=UPI00352B81C3
MTSALGFAVDAVGLAAAGGALCSMGSVIAVGLGGAMLAGQVAKGREADFETQLKKARKRLEDALRLNARFSGLNQDALSGMFETLPGAVTALALTPQDFINWNLDASRIAREIAGKLAVSSPYFAQNSDALDAAQTLLREAFGAVIETESFTTDTTHLYRKAVLERLDTISETQASSDAKLDEVLALMKGRINTDGVSTVALQKIIEKLGADEGLDPPEMLSWLESWVEDYRAMTTRGVNEDAAFRDALERAKQRFDLGDMNASQALMDELAREEEDEKRRVEERKRRRISLLEEAIRLDKLALNADAAVQKYVMIAKEQGLDGRSSWIFLRDAAEVHELEGDNLDNAGYNIAIGLIEHIIEQHSSEEYLEFWGYMQVRLGDQLSKLGQREGNFDRIIAAKEGLELALSKVRHAAYPDAHEELRRQLDLTNAFIARRTDDETLTRELLEGFRDTLSNARADISEIEICLHEYNISNALNDLYRITKDETHGLEAMEMIDSVLNRLSNSEIDEDNSQTPLEYLIALAKRSKAHIIQQIKYFWRQDADSDDAAKNKQHIKNIQEAVDLLEDAIPHFETYSDLEDRLRIKRDLASYLHLLDVAQMPRGSIAGDLEGTDPKNAFRSIELYEDILHHVKRETAPILWADTQQVLGSVYMVLGYIIPGKGYHDIMEKCFENAREVYIETGQPERAADLDFEAAAEVIV